MKVFVVVENYAINPAREEDNVETYVRSVHATPDEAIAAIKALMDERIDEIMDGDENNASNISGVKEWDGYRAWVRSHNCDENEWVIVEKDLAIKDENKKTILAVREVLASEDLCAEAMVSEIEMLVC